MCGSRFKPSKALRRAIRVAHASANKSGDDYLVVDRECAGNADRYVITPAGLLFDFGKAVYSTKFGWLPPKPPPK